MDFDSLLRDPARASSLRTDLLRQSFLAHTDRQQRYHSYAEALGIDPEDSEIAVDLIPLLPSALFKQPDLDLASVPPSAIIKRCVSSGTSGSRSIVPRDETTLTRFFSSVTASLPALFGVERTGLHRGIVLGPTTAEAGDLWFAYAIGCLSLVVPTEHFERNSAFSAEAAASRVRETLSEGLDVALIGPPQRVLELSHVAAGERSWPTLSAASFVITAGGWKTRHMRDIDPAHFRDLVKRSLHIPDSTQIRDSYNMVELNSVIHECEAHEKHVPPWVEAQARDPTTNRPLPAGRLGVLAFLDASATSYPGFVLSEDFGIVNNTFCACGRGGQRVRVVRRMSRIESRGCALKMTVGQDADRKRRFLLSVYRDRTVADAQNRSRPDPEP
jgi:long-chain-fatty-acid---luciferin-component ligase